MVFRHFFKNVSNLFINTQFFINDNEKYLQLTRINLKRVEETPFDPNKQRSNPSPSRVFGKPLECFCIS